MFSKEQVITIFSVIDEFCIEFYDHLDSLSIGSQPKRKPSLSTSEVMTILVLFQLSGVRCFKWFYNEYLLKGYLAGDFPDLVSYNRFVELKKRVVLPMAIFAKTMATGQCTGISFVDSTPIRVCDIKRIFNHKVFDGIATRGKSTMGWFYGFKLHLVVNDMGEIIDFQITRANVDDRQPLKENLLKKIWGRLYGDKGYIGKQLCHALFEQGIHFATGTRKNMKNMLMPLWDKVLLRKRSIIETINDQLKNICMIEHSRHRSFHNFINNLLAGLIAYSFLPKKPSIKYDFCLPENTNQLAMF